jgi:DnaJ-class molecular chaperone
MAKNPWKDDLYGTYTGPRGSTAQWRKAFTETLSPEEAQEIVKEASPWDILGIKADASVQDIRTAYRKLTMEFHPDRYPANKKLWAQEQFIKVEASYTILMYRAKN